MIIGQYGPERYDGDDSQVDFEITFEFTSATHIGATLTSSDGVDLTLSSPGDYEILDTTLTMVTAPASGEQLTIWLDMPMTQLTEFKNTGILDMTTIESGLDAVNLSLQQLSEARDRALSVPITSETSPNELVEQLLDIEEAAENALAEIIAMGGAAATFGTMAEVKATVGVVGATYYTQGYSSAGDGGGGEWMVLPGDYSSEVAADPFGGIYVAFDSDPDGENACLVRQRTTPARPEWWGCLPGTEGTDEMLAALTSLDGDLLEIPENTYLIGDFLEYAGPVNIMGLGPNSIIDLGGDGQLLFASPLETLPDLASNIVAGAGGTDFDSAHGLSSGDVFILHNPTDYSWSAERAYYNDGCMLKVDTVPSTDGVRFFGVAETAYSGGSLDCYKITGTGVSIKNITIIPSTFNEVNVWIDGHVGVSLEMSVNAGSIYTAIEVWRCFDFNIKNISATADTDGAYPVVISNSQKGIVTGAETYSSRHCVAFGGRTGDGCVPTRDILVSGCNLWNRSSLGIGSSDIHGNCENIRYSGCTMNSGANMAGKNVSYDNCTIYGRDPDYFPDGNCIYGSEVVGGVYSLTNNRLITWGDGDSFGIVHLDVSGISETIEIIARNNIIENRSNETSVRAFNIGVGAVAAGFNVNVEIDGFTFKSTAAALGILAVTGVGDVSALMTVVVDRIVAPSGTALMICSNSDNYDAPMRMQKQSGSITSSAASGSDYVTGPVTNYRYTYPRVPHPTVQSGDGTAKIYNNNLPMIGFCQSLTTSYIRPGVYSGTGGTWNATYTVTLSWSVAINEI